MTKKVLISLEDIIEIEKDIIAGTVWKEGIGPIGGMFAVSKHIKDWFNAQPPAPQWVRVEDELPKYGERVLIKYVEEWWSEDKPARVDIAILKAPSEEYSIPIKAAWWVYFDYGACANGSRSTASRNVNDVTHWMPIPPLGEENAD